jgi:hypothetical protein
MPFDHLDPAQLYQRLLLEVGDVRRKEGAKKRNKRSSFKHVLHFRSFNETLPAE